MTSQSTDPPKGDLAGPPEVEAELVTEASVSEHRKTPDAPAPKSAERSRIGAVKFAALGVLTIALAGGGYYSLQNFFAKPKPVETARGAATPTDDDETAGSTKGGEDIDASKIANAPVERLEPPAPDTMTTEVVTPERRAGAPTTASLPPVADLGDALTTDPSQSETPTLPAAATSLESAGAPQGAAPGDARLGGAPAGSAAVPTPTEQIPPAEAEAEGLARLEAEAEARAAEETTGALPPAPGWRNPAMEPQAGDGATGDPTIPMASVASPEAALSTPAPANGQAAKLAAELQSLRASLETESARLSAELKAERDRAAAQAEEIAILRQSLANQQAPVAQAPPETPPAKISNVGETQSAKATLALLALMRAIDEGAPFKAELARVEALSPDPTIIDRLRPIAGEGAPTLARLKAGFPAVARDAIAADVKARSKGPWGALSAGFSRLVSVRPSKPTPGAKPAAVISRMEAELGADDMRGLVEESGALQGAARDAFAVYMAEAERYVATRSALAALTASLIDEASREGAGL